MARVPVSSLMVMPSGKRHNTPWISLPNDGDGVLGIGAALARNGWPHLGAKEDSDDVVTVTVEVSEDGGATSSEIGGLVAVGGVDRNHKGIVKIESSCMIQRLHPEFDFVIPYFPGPNPQRRVRATATPVAGIRTKVDMVFI